MQFLLHEGADKSVKNNFGQTIKDVLRRNCINYFLSESTLD